MTRYEKRGTIYPRGVLKVCQDVHMYTGASSDGTSKEQYGQDLNGLQMVLETWSPRGGQFDAAVRQLIVATLREAGMNVC